MVAHAADLAFVREHIADDPLRLMLEAARFPHIDMPFAALQLECLARIKDKLPEWYACPHVSYPSRLAVEQCSSQETARYKQRFVPRDAQQTPFKVADLTGGLGVDSWYLARGGAHVQYVERDEALCRCAAANFEALAAADPTAVRAEPRVAQGEAEAWLAHANEVDLIYLDPARRGQGDKRLYALSDCSPDVTQLKAKMWEVAAQVVVKISPMADIARTLDLLPETSQVHVLSVRNECKELLFLLDRNASHWGAPQVYCVDFGRNNEPVSFPWLGAARNPVPCGASIVRGNVLLEPNASLMKAGAFGWPVVQFGVRKLHVNSHLYIADNPIPAFPGRQFWIESVIPFSSACLKKGALGISQANVAVRNFPLTVAQWRARTGMRDGGALYVFGTTVRSDGSDNRVVLVTRKCPDPA